MPLTTETQPIAAERLTIRSTVPFSTAESRLRSSIQKSANAWSNFQDKNQPSQPKDRASFESYIQEQIGPHGFMYFNEYQHSSWLPLYEPPTSTITTASGEKKHLKCIRFILGNPLIAITMLKHDLDVGLCVPVELYLVEEPAGGVKVVWYKPAGLIAGYDGAKTELVEAVEVLSQKLEVLVQWVLKEDGEEKL